MQICRRCRATGLRKSSSHNTHLHCVCERASIASRQPWLDFKRNGRAHRTGTHAHTHTHRHYRVQTLIHSHTSAKPRVASLSLPECRRRQSPKLKKPKPQTDTGNKKSDEAETKGKTAKPGAEQILQKSEMNRE